VGKSRKFELNFDEGDVRGHDFALWGAHRQNGKGNAVAAVFEKWQMSGRSVRMLPGVENRPLNGTNGWFRD